MVAASLLVGCSKKPRDVTGQIFVVTEERENIKMGLIGVHVLTDEEFKGLAGKICDQIRNDKFKAATQSAQYRVNKGALEKLRADSLQTEDFYIPEISQLLDESSDRLHGFPNPDPPEFKLNTVGNMIFSQIPPPVAKTDADGRFTVSLKSKVWLVARGERSSVSEEYLWILPYEASANQVSPSVILSNDSNIQSVETLTKLFSAVSGKTTDAPDVGKLEVDATLRKWIEKVRKTAPQVRAKALVAKAKSDAEAKAAEAKAEQEARAAHEATSKVIAGMRLKACVDGLRSRGAGEEKIRRLLAKGYKVVSWGEDKDHHSDNSDMPKGLADVVSIVRGDKHSLAIRKDGTVVAWGNNNDGQCNVPQGLTGVVAISAGYCHSLALRKDGTVVAWGDNSQGQCNMPQGLTGVVAISAGSFLSLALRNDGTVRESLSNDWTVRENGLPKDLTGVVAISAGPFYSLALRKDGSVVAWGEYGDDDAMRIVPKDLSGVVAISAGGSQHSLALRKDGTVVAWGYGQCNVPKDLTDVMAIETDYYSSLALTPK